MLLLHLPVELVQEILLEAVLVRSTRRALTLRLVCKRFSQEVQFILFQRQLLDNCVVRRVRRLEWNHCESGKFWHSYFVYRVLNTESPSRVNSHVISRMRMLAERICEENDTDLKTTIEALCWPAMYAGYTSSNSNKRFKRLPCKLEPDLLSAAAYLDIVPMTRRLLQADDCFKGKHALFLSSPIILATLAGNTHILELFQDYFQQHLPEFQGLVTQTSWDQKMRFRAEQELIKGAAMRGDLELLRSIIYPTNGSRIIGPMGRNTTRAVFRAQCSTHSLEVYKYLGELLGREGNATAGVYVLGKHAGLGNIEMVRFLLDSGTDIRGIPSYVPLVEACRRGQEKIVDLLLERGAKPDFPLIITTPELEAWRDGLSPEFWSYEEQLDSAIGMAAKAGSLSIIQKLINHGADLSHPTIGDVALGYAVTYEYTEIVRFLLRSGAISSYARRRSLKNADKDGLKSMVELLENEYSRL
ncbi:hypothetical protein EAF04_007837 [Stromatinia cepivora]|nr:hypothetical protein EAF04_007837 [Stromatinia cepivora]